MRTPSITLVNDYALEVDAGEIQAGEWIIKSCRRHLADLSRVKESGYLYRFDKKRAADAINFIELLPHTKGRWASKQEKIVLEAWQRFIVGCLFGWVRKSDGCRRFREAYLEIPRKNGKSVLAAGVGLYMLTKDGEFGAEVYSGATTEKQAWEVFRPARLMAQKTPALLESTGIEVNASNLLRLEDFSRFEPLIGNPGDGSSPSCAIVDEFHEHEKPDLYDTMSTGMGARDQPLMFVITTAGSNIAGPCYEKRLEAQKVLQGVFDDDQLFSVIYTLDEGDDWTTVEAAKKANPNYGVSISADFLAAQVKKAQQLPSKQNRTKTKHFNIWVGAREAWLNMEQWNKCGDTSLNIEKFKGCQCVLAIDLATRIDMAAMALVFYRPEADGKRHYYVFPRFYLPESALETSKNADRYTGWASEGLLNLVDADEVDFNAIQAEILGDIDAPGLVNQYQINEVAYDPWQATQLAQNLEADGATVVEFRNLTSNMNLAMREVEAAIASGRFHHEDHPVLNWMASNVVARPDAKENIFPRKELPENKIDGIVATLMGIGRAFYAEDAGAFDDFLGNVVTI